MENKYIETTWFDSIEKSSGNGISTTKLPEIIDESGQGSFAIVLLLAVILITLLFALGIWIDCRHQKIDDEEAQRKKARKVLKLKIPMINKSPRTDNVCIVESMENGSLPNYGIV